MSSKTQEQMADDITDSSVLSRKNAAYKRTKALLDETLSAKSSPFLQFLLHAMENIDCKVLPEHLVIEDCKAFNGYGGFDSSNNEIVLCENKFGNMSWKRALKTMHSTLAHELVHAFDHCRANVDFYNNPKHSMCSEIRAAALSGQCILNHKFVSAVFGKFASYHQKCVKSQAMRSFRALHPDWTSDDSKSLLNSLFPMCYNDSDPFDRIPLSPEDARLSYNAYISRNRYD